MQRNREERINNCPSERQINLVVMKLLSLFKLVLNKSFLRKIFISGLLITSMPLIKWMRIEIWYSSSFFLFACSVRKKINWIFVSEFLRDLVDFLFHLTVVSIFHVGGTGQHYSRWWNFAQRWNKITEFILTIQMCRQSQRYALQSISGCFENIELSIYYKAVETNEWNLLKWINSQFWLEIVQLNRYVRERKRIKN